jgi:hypothetical protein
MIIRAGGFGANNPAAAGRLASNGRLFPRVNALAFQVGMSRSGTILDAGTVGAKARKKAGV